MSDADFIKLYVSIAQATEKHLSHPDSLKIAHIKIFKDMGFTKSEFSEFEKKYRDKPEKWLEIWNAIEKASKE